MDINLFEQLWHRKKAAKPANQAFWDSRAEEFNQRGNGEKRLNKIIELLACKGMLTSESNVLDIGCGPGKYAVEFAKRVQLVTGVDVAPRMIACAQENAAKEGLANIEFKVADWEELDLNSLGWNKKFDLVVASMCPAIDNKAALEKMVNASRGYCFMSSFIERTDTVKDYLSKHIIVQPRAKVGYDKIYCSFNILWLMGFYPEITYIDTEWEHAMPIAKAVDFYCAYFALRQELNSEQKTFIQSYLEQIAKNGLVTETVKAKIAWMNWQVC